MCYMTWYSSAKSVIKHAASQSRSESAASLLIADCRQHRGACGRFAGSATLPAASFAVVLRAPAIQPARLSCSADSLRSLADSESTCSSPNAVVPLRQ